ncbi:MAG: S41 family peptidase [Planctomycetes bacterium]|nr:S41 family peptidase [Planctomycetota bacterium]
MVPLFFRRPTARILIIVLSVCWISPAPGAAPPKTLKAKPVEPSADQDDDYKLMRVLVDTFDEIERNYVKEVDRRKLIEAAIRGMLSELDPYSDYISPEELSYFNQQVEQEFGGIGIQVQLHPTTRRLMVMTPLPGTPAYRAGVRAGDIIMEIEGESTEGMSLSDAVKRLKGKPGEKVTIGVLHEGAKEIEQITIVRDVIHVPTVLGDKYNPDGSWDFMIDRDRKIAYVRLTHFGRHSAEELRRALDRLLADGMRGLILDLRFNPGGLLSQAVKIADMFISEGTIVSTHGRNSPKRVWKATKEGTLPNFPMAVLVNRFSASASEIVSACLQDHNRAVIIGERTWGKGSVQNIIELEGGRSALKLTTAGYLRPSGKNIHRFKNAKPNDDWGVKPDDGYEVKLSAEEMRRLVEYRRKRDVLSENGPPKTDFVDRQLQKALEYIIGRLEGHREAKKGTSKEHQSASKPARVSPSKTPPKPAQDAQRPDQKPKKPQTKPKKGSAPIQKPQSKPMSSRTPSDRRTAQVPRSCAT